MKAWELFDMNRDCSYYSLVFADTREKAKVQANYESPYIFQANLNIQDWRDIGVVRCKELDDCENMSEKDICIILLEKCGWHFEVEGHFYDKDNIDEFIELLKDE